MKKGFKSTFWSSLSGRKGQAGLTPTTQTGSKVMGAAFATWAVIIWVIDMWDIPFFGGTYSGFNVEGIKFFGKWLLDLSNPKNMFLHILLLVLVFVFVIYYSRTRQVPTYRMIAIALFTITILFLISNPGWLLTPNAPINIKAFLHIIFILAFGFVYIRRTWDTDAALLSIVFLIMVDFFGYSLLRNFYIFQFISLLGTIAILFTFAQSPSTLTAFYFIGLSTLILILIISNGKPLDGGYIFSPSEMEVAPLTELGNKIKIGITNYEIGIKRAWDAQIEAATGGYYQGKVEENVREPLGVYLENIMRAETEFYYDEEVMVWGTLKARTLDKGIGVQLRCSVTQKDDKTEIKGMITPQKLGEGIKVQTFDEEDFSCKFNKKQLKLGIHNIKFFANFDFTTMAYLKTYFIDQNRRRAMLGEGVDILDEYGITDKNPVATFTNGPVKIGAETTKSLPVGVYENKVVRLGVTIENQWEGKVKNITELRIEVPDSMGIQNCDGFQIGDGEKTDEKGFKSYTVTSFSEKFQNIETFKSFNCNIGIQDKNSLLGTTPIATRYYRITVNYDYELESSISVNIKKSKVVEENEWVAKLVDKGKITEEFLTKTRTIAKSLGTDYVALLSVMDFETEGTFEADEPNRAGSGAVGLIQFMPTTAASLLNEKPFTGVYEKSVGDIIEKLERYPEASKKFYNLSRRGDTTLYKAYVTFARMSRIDQLDYVELYFLNRRKENKEIDYSNPIHLALAVFTPGKIKSDIQPEDILFKKGDAAYKANSGLDKNEDDKILVREYTDRALEKLYESIKPKT